MMAVTHAFISMAGVSIVLGDATPMTLGIAATASQLPDLDTTESTMGRLFYPLAKWIENRFPHRSITHSLLATAAIALFSLPLYFYWGWKTWCALSLGHLLACFADTFTRQGVQWFYPMPVWCVCGSNPRRRLTTGSPGEYWVLGLAALILMVSIYINLDGGLMTKTTETLGLKGGVEAVYNKSAATNHVYMDVEGIWASDRTPVKKRFWILAQDGAGFLIADAQGIYKTGEQIIITKSKAKPGEAASMQLSLLSFDDEDPLPKLKIQSLSTAVFVSGQLTVDFPEDVVQEEEINQFKTVQLMNNTISFNHCPIEKALSTLKGQYVIGKLEVKVFQPAAKI